MTFLRQMLTVAAKDLRSEIRTKEAINASLSFALVILLLFSFAFDPTSETTREMSGGLLWLAFAFAGVLILNRSFARELPNDCLDMLNASPVPAAALFLGKALANYALLLAIEAICLPVFGVFYNVTWTTHPGQLALVLLLATWGTSAKRSGSSTKGKCPLCSIHAACAPHAAALRCTTSSPRTRLRRPAISIDGGARRCIRSGCASVQPASRYDGSTPSRVQSRSWASRSQASARRCAAGLAQWSRRCTSTRPTIWKMRTRRSSGGPSSRAIATTSGELGSSAIACTWCSSAARTSAVASTSTMRSMELAWRLA